MSVAISLIVSVLALLATFYQLHLQRVHNQKSVKPFAQIAFTDQNNLLAVRLHNNGLGPLVVSGFTFHRNSVIHSNIEGCLALDPKTYWHVTVNDAVQRVILPNSYLTVFEKNLEKNTDEEKDDVREQLAPVTLRVRYRDIYDREFAVDRGFAWFARHFKGNAVG